MPEAARTVAMIVALGFMGLLFIVLPGGLILVYQSRHTKATCEARDPVPRWTDACPLPVLALSLMLGFGVVLVTTHSLGHLVAGTLMGIRFTHWFIGQLRPPLPPGVKIDYSTYLRAPARYRAWMHASGAIVTKLMPFAFVGAALAAEVPTWVVWALVGIGLAQIATDILWSTKASDWKKFRREMDLAQRSS